MKVIKKIILYSITAGVIIGGFFAYAPIRAATVKFFYPLQKDVGNSLVGYWTFDAGDGATDKSGNGNNGTLTGTTQITGQINGARSFNGTSDYITSGSTNFGLNGLNKITISVWIKRSATGNTDEIVMKEQGSGGYDFPSLSIDSSNKLNFAACRKSVTALCPGVVGATSLTSTSAWYHIVAVINNTTGTSADWHLYINGAVESFSTTADFSAYSSSFTFEENREANRQFNIGNRTANGGTTQNQYFHGSIDDVRIYNRALTAEEILAYYNATSQGKFVSSPSSSNISPTASFTSGLVGYWTFDGNDTPWTSATAATTLDRSGNGNTGTLTSMNQSTAVVSGVHGQALTFDGVNDYILTSSGLGLTAPTQLTVSEWIKTTSTAASETVAAHHTTADGLFEMWMPGGAGNKVTFYIYYSAGSYADRPVAATINDGSWHHVVGVYNGDAGTLNMYVDGALSNGTLVNSIPASLNTNTRHVGIGAADANVTPANFFNGSIDDVRIYSRALNGAEVAGLYNLGRPAHSVTNSSPTTQLTSGLVGYWTFDGNDTPWTSATAATTLDRSGNANTGTLTSMNQSSAAIPGVHGQALNFNGTSNYVAVTDSSSISPASALTLSAWVNTSNTDPSKYQEIFAKHKNTPYYGYNFSINTDNTISFQLRTGGVCCSTLTTATTVSTNTWYHLVATYDNATMKIYINGVFNTSMSASGTINGAQDLNIGRDVFSPTAGFFNGKIDDVRIYNRALSADEVQRLYNLGQRL